MLLGSVIFPNRSKNRNGMIFPHSSFCSNIGTTTISKLTPATISKRKYLNDYKPFVDVISLKNMGLIISKAAVLAFSPISLELSVLDPEQLENVDYEKVKKKFSSYFKTYLLRCFGTSVIKKSLDYLIVENLPGRIADKLIKDIYQSAIRKVSRVGRYKAFYLVIPTALKGNITLNLSNFLYEMIQGCYDTCCQRNKPSYIAIFRWLIIKIGSNLVSYLSSSFGVALGVSLLHPSLSRMIPPIYTIGTVAGIVELIGMSAFMALAGVIG